MINIAPPPINESSSSEFLMAFSIKIKTKMITKVRIPNQKVDICLSSVLFPRIIQENDTMTELETSTKYGTV